MKPPFRFVNLLVLSMALIALPASEGAAAGSSPAPTSVTLRVQTTVGGIMSPTFVGTANDGSSRLFVAERRGRIRIVKNGIVQEEPFLDITDKVESSYIEQGLFSIAFPPTAQPKTNFYVCYTSVLAGNLVLARYRIDPGNPDRADRDSEEVILQIEQPTTYHHGGQLAFGPRDGYLYMSTGDGKYNVPPSTAAQDMGSLLGKLLRIDVESATVPYAIPPTNPFVPDAQARPEIWALGFRNPWRFAFDPNTGDLYVGDVGQHTWEEINFISGASGGGENFGWPIAEGNHCYPGTTCDMNGLTPPAIEYAHSDRNCSVVGGPVYRGQKHPQLDGLYFYGDTCTGKIWAAVRDSEVWSSAPVFDGDALITAMGVDEEGSFWMTNYTGNAIHQLVAAEWVYLPALLRL